MWHPFTLRCRQWCAQGRDRGCSVSFQVQQWQHNPSSAALSDIWCVFLPSPVGQGRGGECSMTQQLLCSSSLPSSELGVDHDWRKRSESTHCAPGTILSHTLQSCQSSKGKKMCSLNSWSGPLFFISCHIESSLCSPQLETWGFCFDDFQFQ